MFGLESIADSFDRMYESVQKDWDNVMLRDPGRFAGKTFGPDSWINYFFAIPAGIAWSLGTFTMMQGKALVDVLRLGEGVKSGTAGGVLQDGLRILTVLPAVGGAAKATGSVSRTVRLMGVARIAGQEGAMSCGPTAIAVASRISGQASSMTLGEVGQAFNGIHPNAANFPGMFLGELRSTLNTLSVSSKEVNMAGQGVEEISALAKQGKGPVIFGVQWWETVGGVTRPAATPIKQMPSSMLGKALNPTGMTKMVANAGVATEAPDHWLAAYMKFGKVVVADQYGVRPIEMLGQIHGNTSPFTLASAAFVVPEGALLTTRMGGAGAQFLGANSRWLTSAFIFNMVVVNSPRFWNMDAAIRQSQGKDPRAWPGMPQSITDGLGSGSGSGQTPGIGVADSMQMIPPPNQIPAPNRLSSTVDKDAEFIMSKMPRNSDTREYFQLRMETGLSDDRLRNGLLQLISVNLLQATKWFQMGSKPTPGVVRRTTFRRE